MDFAFYRNFITVAETGNLSAAAKRLGIVQPALSAQIKSIEKLYGVQLFKMQRGKRHIELTEAGEVFLRQARQLCSTEDNISLSMQAFSARASGTLRLAVSHVRTDYFLRRYLLPFAQSQPAVSYQFYDATVEQQQQQLESGLIDFAFANAPLPAAHSFATIKVRREYFYAYYKAYTPTPWPASCSAPTLAHLDKAAIACSYGSYDLLRTACHKYGSRPHIVFIATTVESAVTFAGSGLGIAIVPALPEDAIPSGMQRLPLAAPQLCFEQMLYWSRERRLTPAAELFLEFFKGKAAAGLEQ